MTTVASSFPSTGPRSFAQELRGPPGGYWVHLAIGVILVLWASSFALGFRSALAIFTVIGFGAAAVGLLRPRLGVFGVGILCTLDAPARALLLTGGVWRWNTFNYWLLVVVVFSLPLVLSWRDAHTRVLQLLLAVLGIGLVISPDPVSGIEGILGMISVFGLGVYFARVRSDTKVFYHLGLVCGTLSALGSLAFLMQKSSLPYVNPNALAFFPLTGLFAICVGFCFAVAHSRGQLILGLLAGANLAAVFLTGSRGGMLIAVVCALFLVLALHGLGRRVVTLLIAFLLAIGISSQFTDLQQAAIHRFDRLLDRTASPSERTSGRYDLALAGLELFREHPLGIGTGGFATGWKNLDKGPGVSSFRRGKATPAHSGWIKMMAEDGVPGLALLATYVLSFAIAGVRRRDRDALLLGVLTTAVLAVAFLTTEYFQVKGPWLLAMAATMLLDAPAPGRGEDRAVQASKGRPLRQAT